MGNNEIRIESGLAIAKAIKNKSQMKKLNVNGNQFGSVGTTKLKEELTKMEKIQVLETMRYVI